MVGYWRSVYSGMVESIGNKRKNSRGRGLKEGD